ncbi:MAG: hypothetical protein GX413_07020 [Acetobacter sp.]|nr:hypothetical protein [Acetobacter sp.]
MSETLADVQYSDADFAHDQRAIDFYRDHGCATVMDAFQIANILHTDGMVREASNFYRIAFDLHPKEAHVFPNAHVLLNVSLLCLLKAGENPSEEDMQLLRGYSIPCYNYIRGVMISWREGDHLRALETMGNCYEEFHTGEECDRIYLSTAIRLSHKYNFLQNNKNEQSRKIPNIFYSYEREKFSKNQEKNTKLKFFDKNEASEWLFENYGAETRRIFLSIHHEYSESSFFMMHVIYKNGGWWKKADISLKIDIHQLSALSNRYQCIFLESQGGIQDQFLGLSPYNPILADSIISMYKNIYNYRNKIPDFYIYGKSSIARSINRKIYSSLKEKSCDISFLFLSEREWDKVF